MLLHKTDRFRLPGVFAAVVILGLASAGCSNSGSPSNTNAASSTSNSSPASADVCVDPSGNFTPGPCQSSDTQASAPASSSSSDDAAGSFSGTVTGSQGAYRWSIHYDYSNGEPQDEDSSQLPPGQNALSITNELEVSIQNLTPDSRALFALNGDSPAVYRFKLDSSPTCRADQRSTNRFKIHGKLYCSISVGVDANISTIDPDGTVSFSSDPVLDNLTRFTVKDADVAAFKRDLVNTAGDIYAFGFDNGTITDIKGVTCTLTATAPRASRRSARRPAAAAPRTGSPARRR